MNKNLLRFFLVVLGVSLICGTIWLMQPSATAQKNMSKDSNEAIAKETPPPLNTDEIMLNAGHINVKSEEARAMRKKVGGFSGKRMHLVKFNGPIQPDWYASLKADGLEIIDYIPSYSYLVYGTSASLVKMQSRSQVAESHIQWDGEFLPEYRIHPNVYRKDEKGQVDRSRLIGTKFEIQLYKDNDVNDQTLDIIRELGKSDKFINHYEFKHYVNIVADLGGEEGLNRIAGRSDVISIHPYIEPRKMDERQDIIMTGQLTGNAPTPGNYLTYLAGKGFTQAQFNASNFVVDVGDSGIDNGTATPNHFALWTGGNTTTTDRVVYTRLEGTPNAGSTLVGCDGHGNLNAHIVAGMIPDGAPFNALPHADASGFRFGLGVCPFVKVGSSTIFDPASFTNPNFPNWQARAYNDGARISTNSWGAAVGGAYTTNSQAFDGLVRDAQPATSVFPTAGNQEMTILFSAGNSGSGANTIGAPGTGKNVITVGAAENVQPFGGADQCGIADTGADSANDVISFSSRGPTDDNRKKPEIQAPGTHITGGVAQAALSTFPVTGNGAQTACFNADGICGGPPASPNFFPTGGQQWTTASSGTSHSTPATAGMAALIRQDFINRSLTPPSPAMQKALMMNTTRYMTGVAANDTLWSNAQGMGMVSLDNYFGVFSEDRIIRDQIAGDTLTASGQSKLFAGNVDNTAKPVRVTVTWTDTPGPTVGNAFINNLDLEVTAGGNTFRGNVFTGANSSTGGTADPANNAESVFLPAGTTGPVTIKIIGQNIAGDGVPGSGGPLDQDFALVVQNVTEAPVASVGGTSAVLTTENGTPDNNVPDPGETIGLDLNVANGGTGPSGTVTATLQPSAQYTINAPGTQNYGVINASANATRPFSITVSPSVACGGTITVNWLIQDGANPAVPFATTMQVGVPTVTFTQNFDALTPPALPAGWVSAITGSGVNWASSALTPSPGSPPVNVFTTNPATVGSAALETPPMLISTANAVVEFELNFNTERGSTGTKFDGIILELKIGAGAYQNITTAGGIFLQNGYDEGLISACCSNPLAGLQAWSGNSGGYLPVRVQLPAAANGQNIQLRWRQGTDSSVAAVGSRVDTVRVFGSFACATIPAPLSRADFDGDGRTDLSVFRPSEGNWYLNRSTDGFSVINWGVNGDTQVPGDYDADGKADTAIFRPNANAANPDYFILNSNGFTLTPISWGLPGDLPVIGDYDADGKTDVTVFRPSEGVWYIQNSSNGVGTLTAFGLNGDIPLAFDLENDGRTNLAVFRPSNNTWYIARNTGVPAQNFEAIPFGLAGDKLVPADYDGDNRDDVAVFRPSTGQWIIRRSSNGVVTFTPFGISTDVPVPGDYDGDGTDDMAIYRNGTWWLNRSTSGVTVLNFGLSTDTPIPAKYIP